MEQNLSLYKIFYEVANSGNISKAASSLYISQPAVSKAIQRLEANLKVSLFSRSSRGVRLTHEGDVLYSHIKAAFDEISLGEDSILQNAALKSGQLKIGVSTTLCKYILLPYLKLFINKNPHIKIIIQCQSTNQTLQLIEDEKIDIGLIGEPDSTKNISFHYVQEVEDIFVATKQYLDNLKLRTENNNILENATLMLLDKENMTRQYIDDYFMENNISVNNFLEVTTMDLLIEFAKTGIGVSCVIKDFVKNDLKNGFLVEIPVDIPIHKRAVGFANKKNIYSVAMDSFYKSLK